MVEPKEYREVLKRSENSAVEKPIWLVDINRNTKKPTKMFKGKVTFNLPQPAYLIFSQ